MTGSRYLDEWIKWQEHIARRHHYLPASYLAGFTTSGKKNGQFSVIEVETGRSFRTSPKNVAVERDFNRVYIDGMAPDVIENALAPFEQEAVQAIANIVNTGIFPKGMDYHRIINLLCLIAVRKSFDARIFQPKQRTNTSHYRGSSCFG